MAGESYKALELEAPQLSSHPHAANRCLHGAGRAASNTVYILPKVFKSKVYYNNMLLNNQWITEEIKEEIKKYIETKM